MPLRVCEQVSFDWLLALHFLRRIGQPQFTSDMKEIFIFLVVISFAMICSCQKQDAAAEQELAQRKVELDTREDALIEREKVADKREKALVENEKSRTNVRTIPPAAQSQDVIRDAAEAKAERDKRIQQLRSDIRAVIPDPSQVNSAKVEKDRITRERLAQRQAAQQESQRQKQDKFQQAQKAWMSGAAVSPSAQAAAPITSSALDATSPTPSSPVQVSSPTASPAAEATLPIPSPTPQ